MIGHDDLARGGIDVGALDGIRVLDLTRYVAGPFATLALSDAGADVVKIEPPEGDTIRHFPSTLKGGSRLFLGLNRGKRSLVVNLKKARGQEIVRRMAQNADIFIEGNRPGVIGKLGLDYETLSKENSRLIYASVSAYGQKGPLSKRRGLDPILQTHAGIPSQQTEKGEPRLVQGHFVDYFTGSLTLGAVMLALFERERSGRGQYIDTSLLGSAAAMQLGRLVWASESEPIDQVRDALNDRIARIYDTADGQFYLYLDAEGFWERGLGVLGLEELNEDPEYSTHLGRHADRDAIIEKVQAVLMAKSAEEWVELFEAAGVPSAKVRPPSSLLEDEQMRAMGFLTQSVHPELGLLQMMGAPYVLPAASTREGAPPLLGEHTDMVLAGEGYKASEIDALHQDGVVF
ncbi:MAG: CoA transferase [Nitrospinaceae bacterium]|nr:CoA transferase [Nitrospinaceae bacterium]MBT3433717.1 CoA transferase [Nitrospinaceae bacterium]MBT3823170.1 CoA transferase [Nitrospinaceae bacterium]MBT4093429.1 CoA transferase [Nitrospinaceae bacterium]MBT4429250.1 CoA transferase [Nitrospinaceae bacterium]